MNIILIKQINLMFGHWFRDFGKLVELRTLQRLPHTNINKSDVIMIVCFCQR